MNYWGKAAQDAAPGAQDWHPLAYHALDVAAVAGALLEANPTIAARISAATGLEPTSVDRWLRTLAALHDLGKFALGFQGLNRTRWAAAGRTGEPPLYRSRHDAMARLLLEDEDARFVTALGPLGRGQNAPIEMIHPWMLAAVGHHGKPAPFPGDSLRGHFPTDVRTAASDFARAVLDLFSPEAAGLKREVRPSLKRTSWMVAGLIVAADWLGSNTRFFPYAAPGRDVRSYYLEVAQPQARAAVRAAGLSPLSAPPPAHLESDPAGELLPRFADLFPGLVPTPLQRQAEATVINEGPSLYFLEDTAGAGKTEAALTLAARLIAAERATGVFIGLPSAATALALETRLQAFTAQLFGARRAPEIVLAHGQSELASALGAVLPDPGQSAGQATYGATEPTASRTGSSWMADGARRGLLGQIAVGPLDQALLGAMTVRHQALRLFGLSRSVLVVDEVHACDPYTQNTLKTLLEVHSALGGSAILLTSCLSLAMRQGLIAAFQRGLGPSIRQQPVSTAFPLLTGVSRGGTTETAVEPDPSTARHVTFRRLPEVEDAVDVLVQAAEAGQCGVWIRNTIRETLAAADAIKARLGAERVTIFHARYCLGDRLAIERRVIERFGKDSGPDARRGHVVIGTQVLEQSLDLDFDVLVSDLAPIDRLVQRAGRLQRHTRDASGARAATEGRPAPVLHVMGPSAQPTDGAGWHATALRGGRFVYSDAIPVWRTMRHLEAVGGFTLPADARKVVEAVFGESLVAPSGLTTAENEARSRFLAQIALAAKRSIDVATGYQWNNVAWAAEEDGEPASRLGDGTCMLRFALLEDGVVRPWADTGDWTAWPLSDAQARQNQVASEAEDLVEIRAAARAQMTDRGDGKLLIILQRQWDGRFAGRARTADGRGVTVGCSARRGVSFQRD